MDVSEMDAQRRTPLHWACFNLSTLCLEYILAFEQDLELMDAFGQTALHKACEMAQFENSYIFIKTLIIRGANKHALTEDGLRCEDLISVETSQRDRERIEKLNLTDDEVNRFETAFKDPEFKKMFMRDKMYTVIKDLDSWLNSSFMSLNAYGSI